MVGMMKIIFAMNFKTENHRVDPLYVKALFLLKDDDIGMKKRHIYTNEIRGPQKGTTIYRRESHQKILREDQLLNDFNFH